MTNINQSSCRILFDLQACQTAASGNRGVGRYSSALFEQIASLCLPRDLFSLTNNQLPKDPHINLNQSRHLNMNILPKWGTHTSQNYEQETLDGILHAKLTQTIKPDIIHLSHVFEGFSERVPLFNPVCRVSGQILSATLYDLIPLKFQNHYFQNTLFKRWYLSRIEWLKKADLLLAISESSRQDAIQLLGINPDKIVTIYGGVATHFYPSRNIIESRNRLLKSYVLRNKIALYTGGDDYRKNIKGLIKAFSLLPENIKKHTQLVIICSMTLERKKMYLEIAFSVGLLPEEILITGFVSEQDLVDFYNICDVFVFPSLYEGLGLPVLEAMACGAPVIGSNNSSIRELINREDALFNATSAHAIAKKMEKVLVNSKFSDDLRNYGLKRAKDFSWQQSANLALEAFDNVLFRTQFQGVQCARHGWLPHKRLAILTPIPPDQSGIASYNASFIPFLAKHFEIDLYVKKFKATDSILYRSFRIFDVADFERVANSYDAILYELGNSEFHAHILPILKKYPGIVGLHDAYLSGLFGYLDFNMGHAGSYVEQMLSAHGPNARRYLAPVKKNTEAIKYTMINLPCTKLILDQAVGVISHSPFNLDIARKYYPEGWLAPYRIIPQMVQLRNPITAEEKTTFRTQLGFKANDFIIATFGHIVWTKCGDKLLNAFLSSSLKNDARMHLIFVGELANDKFGAQFMAAIKLANLAGRIRITGYLTDEEYEQYLQIVDLGIQLRTNSRGGTPKCILDSLSYGVPVVVNNEASYTDYPDDVVIKLPADPSISDISIMLNELINSPGILANYADNGLQYVATYHNPENSAAAYAAAIHEFIERESKSKIAPWNKMLASHLATLSHSTSNAQFAIDWVINIPKPQFTRSRLLIDVSHIAQLDHQTGIQRVVKEIVHALYCTTHAGIEPIAVELLKGKLYEAKQWLSSQGLLLPHELYSEVRPIELQRNDILFMLDSSWAQYSKFHPIFLKARSIQVPIITAVYDILPLTLPKENFVEGGSEWFRNWFHDALSSSDALVCISKATADEVFTYAQKYSLTNPLLHINYWHLGSDISAFQHTHNTRKNQKNINLSKSYLLMMGTIEPRKSHALALDAMEILWKNNHELNLYIIGKKGWRVEELLIRLQNNSYLGEKLFFFEALKDDEVTQLYQHASGLLFLSKGEGFGLPLVEAAYHGIPILCSDLPVFREIAGEFATYVELGNPAYLADAIDTWWIKRNNDKLPNTKEMLRLTWEESSEELINMLFDYGYNKRNKKWMPIKK